MEQELTQKGVAEEQPAEVTSKAASEVVSTEEKKTSETRIEDTKEYRGMQSLKDKAEGTLKSVQSELQELRKHNEEQRLVARRKEITDLEGDSEGQTSVRRKHQLQDDVRKLEEQRSEEEGAVQRKYDQAAELAERHNLSLKDARDLLTASTPREMELMAQIKVAEQTKGQVEPLVPSGFKPDSGTSDVGGDSDETFQKRWNAGEEPATKENLERARKIINK